MTEEQTNPQTEEELYKYLAQGSVSQEDIKHNAHTFLAGVAEGEDTTRVGNLNEVELGMARHPVRALKDFALIAEDIINNKFVSDHFKKEAEIITSTSLSKEGFLTKLAVTQTRQIADITKKPKAENKGWFKRKEPAQEGESQ